MSFIQEPVSVLPIGTEEISRADECRLIYFSHDQSYTVCRFPLRAKNWKPTDVNIPVDYDDLDNEDDDCS